MPQRRASSQPNKITWSGTITSVQPRIRLTRSYDQRSHSYLGYNLRIDGTVGDDDRREFMVAVGKAAQDGGRMARFGRGYTRLPRCV